MQNQLVSHLMTTGLITINVNENVSKVAEVFKQQSFHHLPVVDDQGCLKGIISKTDFERIKNGTTLFRNPKIEDYNRALFQSLRACEIMTKDVVQIQPTDTIKMAYEIFRTNKFRALPVIDKGMLVGILTPLDLLDYFFQEIQEA